MSGGPVLALVTENAAVALAAERRPEDASWRDIVLLRT